MRRIWHTCRKSLRRPIIGQEFPGWCHLKPSPASATRLCNSNEDYKAMTSTNDKRGEMQACEGAIRDSELAHWLLWGGGANENGMAAIPHCRLLRTSKSALTNFEMNLGWFSAIFSTSPSYPHSLLHPLFTPSIFLSLRKTLVGISFPNQ